MEEEYYLRLNLSRIPYTELYQIICPDYLSYLFQPLPTLSTDIWAMVLGYTPLEMTNALMRVCKDWYAAIKKKMFWKKRIKNMLDRHTMLDKNLKFCFDPFYHGNHTLKEKVGWLFDSKKILIEDRSIEYIINGDRVCRFIENKTFVINSKGGIFELDIYYLNCDTGLQRKQGTCKDDGKILQPVGKETIYYIDPDTFAYYIGEHCDLIPHGSGTWTFIDGSKYSGKSFAGKPHGIDPKTGIEFFGGDRVRNNKKLKKIN